MTTSIESLREENQVLAAENDRLQSQLDSKHQKHPAPLTLRIVVWFAFALSVAAVILITAKAITG